MNDKNVVYVYDIDKKLKCIKSFDTLEECFNFVSEQNRKYTMNIKLREQTDLKHLQLELF